MPQPIDPSSLPDPMPLGTSKSMPPPPPVLSGPAGAAGARRKPSLASRIVARAGWKALAAAVRAAAAPIWLECRATSRATGRSLGGLAQFAYAAAAGPIARGASQAAMRRLGLRLIALRIADPALVARSDDLESRGRAAGNSATATALVAARDALAFQAAAASLDRSSVPPGTDREYGRALSARAAESRLATLAASARRAILPPARADRMRVVAGYLALVMAVVVALRIAGRI